MGYRTVEEVDRAMKERQNLREMLRRSAGSVRVEMMAYIGLRDDCEGDPVMDELLDARLRLQRMDATRREAFSKLSDPQVSKGR